MTGHTQNEIINLLIDSSIPYNLDLFTRQIKFFVTDVEEEKDEHYIANVAKTIIDLLVKEGYKNIDVQSYDDHVLVVFNLEGDE